MESIRYPYRKNILALIFGVILLGMLLGPLSMLPIAIVLNPSGLVALIGEVGLLTFMGTCGLALLAVLWGVWAIYASQIQKEAILTPETFSYGRRGRLTTIRLAEIARITQKSPWWDEFRDWVITIETVDQQKISFTVHRLKWEGFDYQAILRDLLARLPSTAQVDPKVRIFAETGKIP
ncbi:MAG: hypothetical protein WHX52_21760 [Anaerolineae bacterium]